MQEVRKTAILHCRIFSLWLFFLKVMRMLSVLSLIYNHKQKQEEFHEYETMVDHILSAGDSLYRAGSCLNRKIWSIQINTRKQREYVKIVNQVSFLVVLSLSLSYSVFLSSHTVLPFFSP